MTATKSTETLVQQRDPAYTYGIIHPTPFPFRGPPMASSPAIRLDHAATKTAAALARTDTFKLPDGAIVEHGLLAMAADLWAARPEANDPHWIAAEWNGAVIAFRIDA